MMHDASGLGMSWLMWGMVLLPIVTLALAVYVLVRTRAPPPAPESRQAAADPTAAAAEPAPALDASQRRLLDEDERRLYELVVGRGGDVPQGDLVPLSGYSKAKVSRVIDRLEAKGLLVRIRRGMGNRVVVPPAKQP